MSNYRRSRVAGGTYFFTLTTLNRLPVLTEAPVRAALREAILQTRITHPFEIDAWVLLPDHLHCIWTLPHGDADFSIRWSNIKRGVSLQCGDKFGVPRLTASRTKRRESGLWQRRFWEHQIRDERDFARHADYIHWNPVKHGLVAHAMEWPYSTFHRFVREGAYLPGWGVAGQVDLNMGAGE